MKKIIKIALIPLVAAVAVSGTLIATNLPVENQDMAKVEPVIKSDIVEVKNEEVKNEKVEEIAPEVISEPVEQEPAPVVLEKLSKEQVIRRVNSYLLSYDNDRILKQMGIAIQAVYNPVWDKYSQGLISEDAIETETESCKGKVVIQAEDILREKRSYTKYQC